MTNPIRDYFTVDQLVLLFFYENGNKPASIEDIKKHLNAPRSTLVDHLESLRIDGFLKVKKDGKMKYYGVDPDIMEKVGKSLGSLREAYVYALGFIRQKQLKEIRKFERVTNESKQ